MRVSNSGKTSVVVKLLKKSKVTANLKVLKFHSQPYVLSGELCVLENEVYLCWKAQHEADNQGAVFKFRIS